MIFIERFLLEHNEFILRNGLTPEIFILGKRAYKNLFKEIQEKYKVSKKDSFFGYKVYISESLEEDEIKPIGSINHLLVSIK